MFYVKYKIKSPIRSKRATYSIAEPFFLSFFLSIRSGTVHRCHGSVRTSVRGSRFDTILVLQEKKSTMLSFFSFDGSKIKKIKIHLDVKILYIITLYIYTIYFVFIVSVHK